MLSHALILRHTSRPYPRPGDPLPSPKVVLFRAPPPLDADERRLQKQLIKQWAREHNRTEFDWESSDGRLASNEESFALEASASFTSFLRRKASAPGVFFSGSETVPNLFPVMELRSTEALLPEYNFMLPVGCDEALDHPPAHADTLEDARLAAAKALTTFHSSRAWERIDVQAKLFPDPFPNSSYWLAQDDFLGVDLDLDWADPRRKIHPEDADDDGGAKNDLDGEHPQVDKLTSMQDCGVTEFLFVHYVERSRQVCLCRTVYFAHTMTQN